MAQTALKMTAHGVGEKCAGCFRDFVRGEQMNAVEYADGEPAGWHCGDCVATWNDRGEDALPRWTAGCAAAREVLAKGREP